MDQLQFYPTPPTLAKRAWQKFRNTNWVRILEPSAGNGALAKECPERQYSYGRHIPIDCYEIDISHHPALRSEGFNVVGFDFTQIQSAAMYSHILLNPPFKYGAEHTLLAWDKLLDGEIVAILNAETVRNPFSRERKRLVELIADFGEVEFIEGAFNTDETEVKTDVEIALIWLQKKLDVESIVGDVISTLRADLETGNGLARDFQQMNQVAHMNSTVENLVIAFNAAVKTMQELVFAGAKASYYAGMLGDTMAVRRGSEESKYVAANISTVKEQIAEKYIDLKDRAWSQVLTSTDVTSKLSSKTAKELERQFETIKKMEFTASNIYGFLLGLVEKQGELQVDMALELFDLIGTYHSDNTVFYRGSSQKTENKAR
jgi:hypothetical protein